MRQSIVVRCLSVPSALDRQPFPHHCPQVISKLTADNLVFVMQLRSCEEELAAANKERAALKLAVEQQKGPWFESVRAGIEKRVREALQRAEQLEKQLAVQEAQHKDAMQARASGLGAGAAAHVLCVNACLNMHRTPGHHYQRDL